MNDLLCVFAKAPIAGRVKTRLVPPLTAEEAAAVAEACLHDVVDLALSRFPALVLFHDPGADASRYFEAEFPNVESQPQAGADLGERLQDAFEWAFERGADRVCIVGSDVPTLPSEFLTDAFDRLAESDAVLGPTNDGGYYLVGIRANAWPRAHNLFTGIAWSTASVLTQTVDAAAAVGLDYSTGREWYDVDDAGDLARAAGDAAPGSRLANLLAGPSHLSRKVGRPL